MDVATESDFNELYPILDRVVQGAHLQGFEQYKMLWEESIRNPKDFWEKRAREFLSWMKPFSIVTQGTFSDGDIAWFADGELNVSVNCLDRHLESKGNQTAIIWEGDHPSDIRKITYCEAFQEVCRLANLLKEIGLRKGDTCAIYLSNCPEALYAMLACARIGVIHSVIFGGFSAEALADRIIDAHSRVVITANEAKRGEKIIPLKQTVDEALLKCPCVEKVLVLKKTPNEVPFNESRDIWLRMAMDSQRPYCPPVAMNSEDILFLLYTSGSTGKPKGVAHSQAGYLLYASMTHKFVFDYRPGDVYACVADVGWITGHSYIVYGPLCNGATTLMFEGVPLYPDAGRYWDMVARHKITQLYTAPTAIRTLMRYGKQYVEKYDRSSLRILGTVGEPINPEAWRWYFDVVGSQRCAIVDTYWQTETGGFMLTPIPGCIPQKAGSATLPFFGVKPEVLDATTGKPLHGNNVNGVLAFSLPWPSLARTVYNDHQRYLATYMKPYLGYYFTGDGAFRDKDGYYWISGRVDDVINVSGHRLGTAEIESALVSYPACAEAAVVGVPHEIKGQGIFAYCILKLGYEENEIIRNELLLEVRKKIGPFATPDVVLIVSALPKTRSGKIMRRLLRKISSKETRPEQLGDISTLAEPSVVQDLIQKVNEYTQNQEDSKKQRKH